MKVTIYHNPRCTKSRLTLQLLQDRGIEPNIIEYLKTPPDAATLSGILKQLDMTARELMRKNEEEYKQHNLGGSELDQNTLIEAMVKHPKLIERPIVIANNKAAIGRPPENVLEIL